MRDIDTAVADSLKELDPTGRLEKRTSTGEQDRSDRSRLIPSGPSGEPFFPWLRPTEQLPIC